MEFKRFIIKIEHTNGTQYLFNKRTLLHSEDMAKQFISIRTAKKYLRHSKFAGLNCVIEPAEK